MRNTLSTRRRVSHAHGYLGLGMFKEAAVELDLIAKHDQSLPEVQSTRLDLHMERKQWHKALRVGKDLARTHPEIEHAWIGWAYALRELDRIAEARTVLLEAEPRHGKSSAVLHYNLACYASLLGEMSEAQTRLTVACRMDDQFDAHAAVDPDLQGLRDRPARRV
jgi:predicted Zn-dependent protease